MLKVLKSKGVKKALVSFAIVLSLSFGLGNNAYATTASTSNSKGVGFLISNGLYYVPYAASISYSMYVNYTRDSDKTTTSETSVFCYITPWSAGSFYDCPEITSGAYVYFYNNSTNVGTQILSTDTNVFWDTAWLDWDCKDISSNNIYYYLNLKANGTVNIFQNDALYQLNTSTVSLAS